MSEEFMIKDDKEADDIIVQIREAEEERDRLISLAQEKIQNLTDQIEALKDKCYNETTFLKSRLNAYFDTVKTKETKTQKTYKLISGTLVFKKPSVKIAHNDEALIEYLKENDGKEFIKVKESVDWAGYKKILTVNENDEVIDTELGTVIPSEVCSLEEVPASFDIKF